MRTAGSVSVVLDFDVTRPKALLGDENFRAIADCAKEIARTQKFRGMRLSAAGSATPTMQRIATDIGNAVGLPVDNDGDFLVRIRRSANGWQTLIRLTPRPLSVRPWRVVDYPVAVNACIAAAMIHLAKVRPADRVLNVMCGSATIAIEAAIALPTLKSIVAIDNDEQALQAARTNAIAAEVDARVKIQLGDATNLDIAESSIDVAFVDPPWTGYTRDNLRRLYQETLAELARVVTTGGRVVWLSHQVEMSSGLLREIPTFSAPEPIVLNQGGLHPSLWVLTRS
jgi:23S rRNA G2445 N2-methylase RlmL